MYYSFAVIGLWKSFQRVIANDFCPSPPPRPAPRTRYTPNHTISRVLEGLAWQEEKKTVHSYTILNATHNIYCVGNI